MTPDKTRFTLRVDESILEKIKQIADKSHRSINAQVEYVLEKFIQDYEKEHGKIE
jgi:hypothetical protein